MRIRMDAEAEVQKDTNDSRMCVMGPHLHTLFDNALNVLGLHRRECLAEAVAAAVAGGGRQALAAGRVGG